MKCHGCGVEKDPAVLEPCRHADPEDNCGDRLVRPFVQLDCEPHDFRKDGQWKQPTVCHDCFHKLEPDMWISERCWEFINPVVPFESLPDLPPDPPPNTHLL
jgi:hypothetical protein